MEGSKALSLSKGDIKKIGKGLLIALTGAALTYITEQIPNVDFGVWTPAVVAGWSVIVNAVRQLLTDTRTGV